MITEREKRIRRPRNIFSPTDNFDKSTHYLLYFDSTDSYSIVLTSSIKSTDGNTATLYVHGKKMSAMIITSGTLDLCEAEQRKRTRQSQETSEDEEDRELNPDENEYIGMHSSSEKRSLVDILSFPT